MYITVENVSEKRAEVGLHGSESMSGLNQTAPISVKEALSVWQIGLNRRRKPLKEIPLVVAPEIFSEEAPDIEGVLIVSPSSSESGDHPNQRVRVALRRSIEQGERLIADLAPHKNAVANGVAIFPLSHLRTIARR